MADMKQTTLRLSQNLSTEVNNAADKMGITMQEFIRRAIGMELFLMEEKQSGARIFIEAKDGKIKEVVTI